MARQPKHPPVPGDPARVPPPVQVIRTTVPAKEADAPLAVVSTTPEGLVQAVEGLASCLEKVLEVLPVDEEKKAQIEVAADALRKAKAALGLAPTQGEMSKSGRDAHAAQRADPSHSPHFGG
jgi:hypothetical protein